MESVKDLEQAKLDKLKQMVEVQNLDLTQIEKLLSIMQVINKPIADEVTKNVSTVTQLEPK